MTTDRIQQLIQLGLYPRQVEDIARDDKEFSRMARLLGITPGDIRTLADRWGIKPYQKKMARR